MTLADFRRRGRGPRTSRGFEPPPATFGAVLRDLRWQWALYREDGLPLRERVVFLGLRVAQRLAYNAGWWIGGRR